MFYHLRIPRCSACMVYNYRIWALRLHGLMKKERHDKAAYLLGFRVVYLKVWRYPSIPHGREGWLEWNFLPESKIKRHEPARLEFGPLDLRFNALFTRSGLVPAPFFRWEVGETNQNTVACSPVERTSAAYFAPQSYISQKGTVLLLKSLAECRDKIMYESFTYVIISTCFLKEIFK